MFIVLLFHGYATAKSSLLPEAKAFHELGYATFLVDFRGSGGSSGNTVSIGYYEADDVAIAFEYVHECPVLMLYGEKDPRVTIEQSKSVFDNLKGKKHLDLFEGAGHESYYRYSPVKWTQVVSKFLKILQAKEA